MADIFGYNANFSGAKLLTAQEMILTVRSPQGGGSLGAGEYLVQNVSIQYQQPVQPIRELSTANTYWNALPPQGNCNIGRIVGNKPITAILGAPAQGIWTAPQGGQSDTGEDRIMELKPVSGSGSKYIMYGCIVENLNTTTDANGTLVQEQISIRFGRFDIEG